MIPGIVDILDRALVNSIWVFLVTNLVFLIFASWSLRVRRRKLGDLLVELPEQEQLSRLAALNRNPAFNQWKISLRTTLFALLCACFYFLAFLFLPLPIFQNFSSDQSWKIQPLRLTSISYDRFYEGFSLEGEVWNQTDDPIEELKAAITVWSIEDEPLDEIVVDVEPVVLEAGTAGEFSLRYAENSPLIKGYQVSFQDVTGAVIPHVTGFDVQ
jgi:hypothetical protein